MIMKLIGPKPESKAEFARSYRQMRIFFWIFIPIFILVLFVDWHDNDSKETSNNQSATAATTSPTPEAGGNPVNNCNTLGIEVHGELVTYLPESSPFGNGDGEETQTASDDVVASIEQAQDDDSITAILLEVDSSGGSPVAGEEIANALKRSKKPAVVLIREMGLSAAYWAATGAEKIFASENSMIGSIGVRFSYLDAVEKNKKEGLTYNTLSTGKFKNIGDPDKPLTEEEKRFIQNDLNIIYKNFISAVAKNRKLDQKIVGKFADGSYLRGQAAIKEGFIDEIGDIKTVEEYLFDKVLVYPEICW